jgi:hypothetical protein
MASWATSGTGFGKATARGSFGGLGGISTSPVLDQSGRNSVHQLGPLCILHGATAFELEVLQSQLWGYVVIFG